MAAGHGHDGVVRGRSPYVRSIRDGLLRLAGRGFEGATPLALSLSLAAPAGSRGAASQAGTKKPFRRAA